MRYTSLTLAGLASLATAQRPTDVSICDYYTKALLKESSAKNEATVLTLLVNTVVLGNSMYKPPKIEGVTFPNVQVPGILAKGKFNGTDVNLAPYFNGGLASSNRGGMQGVGVNFLDDGGAAPLMMNKPANGTNSNQYRLLTHLYQFFGTLLGCSEQGKGNDFPAYSGEISMTKVHKFMNLDENQMGYFITQVGLAAASFGVAEADIKAVGESLNKAFNMRCAPAISLGKGIPEVQQAICLADSCPLAPNANCSAYDKSVKPGVANTTLADGQGNSSMSAMPSMTMTGTDMTASMTSSGGASATGSGMTAASPGAAAANAVGLAAGGLAFAAFLL